MGLMWFVCIEEYVLIRNGSVGYIVGWNLGVWVLRGKILMCKSKVVRWFFDGWVDGCN